MSIISLDFSDSYSQSLNKLLNRLANDSSLRTQYNKIIGEELNKKYVPKQTGELRKHMFYDANGVHWGGLPYIHYQYEGIVYAPNFPVWHRGQIIGWKSPKGAGTKTPTSRMLGSFNGTIYGWKFGYTTPGTMHHWDAPYTGQQWGRLESGEETAKARINIRIYREVVQPYCRRR